MTTSRSAISSFRRQVCYALAQAQAAAAGVSLPDTGGPGPGIAFDKYLWEMTQEHGVELPPKTYAWLLERVQE